jgi:predicted transcriptional regulator
MTTTKKKTTKKKTNGKPKHGALSARARRMYAREKAKGGVPNFHEIARRLGMTAQGVRNAVRASNRIGSKSLMRAEALTPAKQLEKKVA